MGNQNQSPTHFRRCKVCRCVNPIGVSNCQNCHADLRMLGEDVYDFANKPTLPWKGILIGTAAVLTILLLAVTMFRLGAMSGDKDPAESQASMQNQPTESTQPTEGQKETVPTEPADTEPPSTEKATDPPATEAEETQDTGHSAVGNILREDPVYYETGADAKETAANWPVLGSSIKRREISSVTFLSSVENAPDDAWDVSEYENGEVLAWTEPKGGLYDLYIAAEDGVHLWLCYGLFSGYINATRIDFDGVTTYYAVEMSFMFYACESLTALDLSGFDTSMVADMNHMFYLCSSLTELDLSKFDTSNVTDMAGMFRECTALKKLDLSGFDTSKVTDMNNMFYLCSNLTELDLSSFDTSKVTDMSGMFRECKAVKKIILDPEKFDTSNVRNMCAMFYDCNALRELDISGFDTSQVTDMSWMFYICPPINPEDVQHFNTENVTEYEHFMRGSEWKKLFE